MSGPNNDITNTLKLPSLPNHNFLTEVLWKHNKKRSIDIYTKTTTKSKKLEPCENTCTLLLTHALDLCSSSPYEQLKTLVDIPNHHWMLCITEKLLEKHHSDFGGPTKPLKIGKIQTYILKVF